MRYALLPATTALTILTALALLGAAAAVRPPGPPPEADGAQEAANRRVAHRFYDAANTVIATGDLATLAPLVAPDLLSDATDAEPAPAGLARRLRALHASSPALRLTVAALAVDADLAIVHVVLEGRATTSFLGLEIRDQPAPWSPIDVLRLAGGRIVEHSGATSSPGWLEPVHTASLYLLPGTQHRLTVNRLSLAAGARHVARAVSGARLLVVERGEVNVGLTGIVMGMPSSATLAAGEHLILRPDGTPPRSTAYLAANEGTVPAMLLDLAVAAPDSAPGLPSQTASPAEDGVAFEVLVHSQTVATPTGPVVVAVGSAVVAPGERLAWAEARGPVLLHVGAGTVRLDPGAGVAWVQDARGRSVTLGDDPLAAGDDALVVAGNAVALRNGADRAAATLLLMTLLPADGPRPGITAMPTSTAVPTPIFGPGQPAPAATVSATRKERQ